MLIILLFIFLDKLWIMASFNLGSKKPRIRLSSSIGLIDKQYRGEIIAIVDNLSDQDYHIEQGARLKDMQTQ